MAPFLKDDPHPEKSGFFAYLNTNKRGMTLNLKTATGKAIFLRLIEDADILVESFSPRVMPSLGLTYERLKEINPRLAMVSISNFGQTGPYRDFKASELVLNAMGAEMYSRGVSIREPLKLGGNAVQFQAGSVAALATTIGYWGALERGYGDHLDVSIFETQISSIDARFRPRRLPVLGKGVDPKGARRFSRLSQWGLHVRRRLRSNRPCQHRFLSQGLEDVGLGYSVLKEVNPRLIMVSLPGYGRTGPYQSFHGFGYHQEAFSGHTWLRGYPDLDPSYTSVSLHADACAGVNSALAVMMALAHRRRTGKGQFIDMAQTEAAISHQADAVLDYTMNGRARSSLGNRHTSAAPCGAYRCQGEEEWVAITVNDDQEWAGFCRALGNPNWTKEERFSSSPSRWSNQDDLDRLVEEWTRQQSSYDVMYALQREGVPAGPVLSNKDAWDDPQLIDRGQFEDLYREDCGAYRTPGLLWRAKNTPNRIRRPAVRLGEHNEYVYKQVMGISEAEYAQLEQEGHIGMELAPHLK